MSLLPKYMTKDEVYLVNSLLDQATVDPSKVAIVAEQIARVPNVPSSVKEAVAILPSLTTDAAAYANVIAQAREALAQAPTSELAAIVDSL